LARSRSRSEARRRAAPRRRQRAEVVPWVASRCRRLRQRVISGLTRTPLPERLASKGRVVSTPAPVHLEARGKSTMSRTLKTQRGRFARVTSASGVGGRSEGTSTSTRKTHALLGVVALACGVLLALAVQSSEAFAASWASGVETSLPANAGSKPEVFLGSVSCASAGNCGAVGQYLDSSSHERGLLLSETGGTWATGVEASPPANAGSNPAVYPSSVSCASAGNCSAVGNYVDSSGHRQGLLLSETAGTWATGVEASLPANAGANPGVDRKSVSWAKGGNCGAGGHYLDRSNHPQGLRLSETAGTWAPGGDRWEGGGGGRGRPPR